MRARIKELMDRFLSTKYNLPDGDYAKGMSHAYGNWSSEVEKPPKVNTAYGSAPDDFADTGLVEPPKVNMAYGSRADDYADTGLVAPKINTAYGSVPDDLADTGLVEPPKVNIAYGSGYGESTPYDIVRPERQEGVYVSEEGYDERIEELEKELWDMENYSMKLEREFNGKEDKNDVIRYDFYQDERIPEVKAEIQRLKGNRELSGKAENNTEKTYLSETDAAVEFAQTAVAQTDGDQLERGAIIITAEVPIIDKDGKIVMEKRYLLSGTFEGAHDNLAIPVISTYISLSLLDAVTGGAIIENISYVHTHPNCNCHKREFFSKEWGDMFAAGWPGIDNFYLVSPGGKLYMYDTDTQDYWDPIETNLPKMQNPYYGNSNPWQQNDPIKPY